MIDCINTNIYLNINNVISIISFRIFSKKGIHQSISHFESRRISPNHYSTHITPITGPIASIASSPRFHDEVTTTPSRYSPTHFPRSLSRQIHGQKASPLSETNSTNDRDRNGCGVSTDTKRQLRGFRYSSWSCGLRRRHRSRKRGERSGYNVACTRIPEVI